MDDLKEKNVIDAKETTDDIIKLQNKDFRKGKRMESIIENIISGVIVIDEETHIIQDVNPVAEEIIGLPREEIIGHECHMFVCPAERGKCPISDLGQTVNKSERVLINAKGEKIPILKSVAPVSMEDGNCLIESFVDLSQIKKTENDLMHAKIEAESANRAKSDFLATMSHELRTPLNSIIGFSDLVLEGNAGELTNLQERYLGNISSSGKHLLSLINNVLDLSKIEAGKLDLHLEGFHVEEVFTEVSQLVAPLANKKEVKMSYSIDENLNSIYADKIRFKQILYNLISNAIKFTPKDGSIDVSIAKKDNMARVSVKDTGIGISDEDMRKLFQPFTQLDSAANRQYEGTGLGLSLVKRFVELHNGKIRVESIEGSGANFIFELPLKEGIDKIKNKNQFHETKICSSASDAASEIAEKQNFTGDEKLILIVEDDDKSRELLEATLMTEGYRVKSVNNGKEALEIARELKPFMITLDIMMPGMDGWEVLGCC
ncbi:MAG: ATP-binding protein [Methanolobus sp.]